MNGKIFYKVKYKDIILFILFLILTVIAIVIQSGTFSFLVAIIQLCMVIIKARFSFFSFFAVLLNYCLLENFLEYSGIPTYGILSLGSVDIYFYELCYCCYILNFILFIISYFTNTILNEKKIYLMKINISKNAVNIILIMAVVITIMIFPSLPHFDMENRFNTGILPFTGWSCIPFFFLAVGILSKKQKPLVFMCSGFVILWYITHGERVDVMGLVVYLLLFYFNSKERNIKQIIKVFVIIFIFLMLLIYIGGIRDGNFLSLPDIFVKLLIQPTACDVTNVFNVAVDNLYSNNSFRGLTYLSYLVNCIPGLDDPYSFQVMIGNRYRSAGGGIFFAEPVANYGFIFCGFVCIIYFCLVAWLIKKHRKYECFIYIELCLSIFRSAWYGLNYPIVTILYFVPFVLVLDRIMSGKF